MVVLVRSHPSDQSRRDVATEEDEATCPLVRYTEEDGCIGVHRQDGVRVDTLVEFPGTERER